MKKLHSIIILLIVVSLFMVGCNKSSVEVSEDKKADAPLRIVSTYKPATGIVVALGGADKLVGIQDGGLKDKLLIGLVPDIKDKVIEIGSKKEGINIESVLALEPDLVVMYPTKDADDTVKKLEDQGIEVISISPESIDLLENDINEVGKAMQVEDKAEELVNYFQEKVNMIEERIPSEDQRKTVYLAGARGVLSTSSSTFFQHFLIESAGGVDVASELVGGWNEITIEQLMNWNPQVIASVMYCPDGKPEQILELEGLAEIDAVKSGQVFQIPSNLGPWDMPEPRSILGIMWLSKNMYPELFEDMDINEEVNNFHEVFYGKSFEELGGKINDGRSTN